MRRYPTSSATLRPLVLGQRLDGIVVEVDLTHDWMGFQTATLAMRHQISDWLAMATGQHCLACFPISASSAESLVFASWMLTIFISSSFCLCKPRSSSSCL